MAAAPQHQDEQQRVRGEHTALRHDARASASTPDLRLLQALQAHAIRGGTALREDCDRTKREVPTRSGGKSVAERMAADKGAKTRRAIFKTPGLIRGDPCRKRIFPFDPPDPV